MTKKNEMIIHCIKVFSTRSLSKERNSWKHLKLFFLTNPNIFLIGKNGESNSYLCVQIILTIN